MADEPIVELLSSHWSDNTRIQNAANNKPPLRQNEPDRAAVKLLQEALIFAGFPMAAGADGGYGPQTARAVIAAEKRFGFVTDNGVAGREVLGALDLTLRGWDPPDGPHWGGLIARTIVPLAQRKVRAAIAALAAVHSMLATGGFDFVTVDGVTLSALNTHFKLVAPGGTKLAREEFIALDRIVQVLANFRGIERTLGNPAMIRNSICSISLDTAAEAPFGGPILFGPPYSDFAFGDPKVTNIAKTGENSLAAMMIHEATHVIDGISSDNVTTHISESTAAYETQSANFARHNPSAYATFAAHIFAGADRPREDRFGLGKGRPF